MYKKALMATRLVLDSVDFLHYQKELADKIGTNNSSICDWECGRTEPSIDYIVKLCDFFEIDADYLIGRKDIQIQKKVTYYVEKTRIRRKFVFAKNEKAA